MGQAIKTGRKVILIVEDEPFIRYDLVDFFEDAGFEVYEAGDADEAIRMMDTNESIRVVLTDVNMPGSMDGVKLAFYIRDRFPPTLLLIASGAHRLRASDIPPGATFFPKPFDPRALLRTINEATV